MFLVKNVNDIQKYYYMSKGLGTFHASTVALRFFKPVESEHFAMQVDIKVLAGHKI